MSDLIISSGSHTNLSAAWIENLALEEINMEESGVVHLNEHLLPYHYLEESSIDFVNKLRDLFEVFVTRFNEYRGLNGKQIRIFKTSGTINDFMLYRNSLRLIIARKSNDLISIGFLAATGETFGARNSDGMEQFVHEIAAHVGPFNKISWQFRSETVDHNALVKYYLAEFVRRSAQ